MCSSSGNVKGKGRGAVAVSLSGLGVLGLGLWFCVHWHLLAAHYHMGRLAEATTFEEAKPWLEALARDSQNPDACVLILEKIGGDRQELTYWFFSYISLRPPAPLLPLLRSFAERLDRDERLLSLWAHYLRWREGRNFVEMLERTSESFDKKVCGHFVGIYRGHPEQLEPRLYLSRASNLAYAWLFGLY